MADEFGIRLSVSAADLLSSINTALDKINADPALNKLKLGIDTSDIDKAVKRLKTEISSITNNISVPKIDLGISGSPEKSTLGSVDKSQTGQINEIVKAYMNAFSIIKQSGTETAKDIQLKFNNALTDFFEAKSSGNADNIKRTFDELTMLTKNYTKQFKNTDAINYLNTLKDGLEGIVPVSRDVFEDLKYIYDGGRNAANALNKAFGVKGWKIDNWTDVYLESLPDWMLSKDSYTAPVQGLQKLIELFQRAREQAKIKLDIFSDGSGIEKMTTFLAHCEELLDIRQRQAESAEKTAQSEKQVTAALQSEAEVAEKLRNAMTPVIGDGTDNYVSRVLTDIGSYKGVVDALGQALDRLSSAKGLNMSAQMSDLNDCLTMFREGMNSPEELIRNLSSFAAAERNVTAEINAEKTAVNNVTAEIDKLISKKKQANIVSDKSKGGKAAGNVGIGIDAGALIKSINAAVREINKNNTDSLTKIKLSANETGLRSSIRQAVSDINKSKILDSSPVKLSVTFKNIKSAVSALNKQLSGMTVKVNVNSAGTADGNGTVLANEQITKGIQQQAQAQNNLKQEANDTAQAIIDTSNREKNALNSVDEAIAEATERYKKLGNEIKTVQVNAADGTPVSKSVKTGTNVNNTTDRFNYDMENNQFVLGSQTIEENTAAAKANIEKMIQSAVRLNSELKKTGSAINDKNTARPIKDKNHLNALNAKYNEIAQSIIAMTRADSSQYQIIRENIKAQISDLKVLEREYRNAEYAANQLAAKSVDQIRTEQLSELDKFISKIVQSNVPISRMETDINNLKTALDGVNNKETLSGFLNNLDVAKSKFGALNEQVRTINTAVKALDRIDNLSIFGNNRGNSEVISLMGSVDELRNKYLTLKNDFANANTPEKLASVNEQLAALQAELDKIISRSGTLKTELNDLKRDSTLKKRIANATAALDDYMNKNQKTMFMANPMTGNTFGSDLIKLRNAMPTVEDSETLDRINSQFSVMRSQIRQLGAEGNTFWGEMKEKAVKFIKWTGMTLLVTRARMYFRQLFTTVYELDTALVDLKKTFNGTEEELEDFYFEANKLAKQMGITTAEAIKLGSAWSRLGYSSNETMKKMAEMSAMFAAISPDMNSEQAQNGLVSIMKAFGIDPENVLDGILSKVNIIGNTAATSNGEIVEMLQKSSSAMREANNTLEETIALETAAVEITRDSASVGTAYKTISARLRGLDEETLEVIEDTEILTGKFAEATKTVNNPGGISLFTDASKQTFKSTYQIIKELWTIWDDLTDKQHAKIEDIVGGKRQLQIVAASISNFKAAEKALDDMANSAGSAEAELATYQESAEYLYNQFKETFTSIAQNAVKRDDLKSLIKFGTSMLELVDGIVSKIGIIPTVLSTIVGITASKNFANSNILGFNNMSGKMTVLGADVGYGWGAQVKDMRDNLNIFKKLRSEWQSGTVTQNTLDRALLSTNDDLVAFARNVQSGVGQTEAMKTAAQNLGAKLNEVSIKSKLAAGGVKILRTAASMLISMGISLAINKVIEGFDLLINKVQHLREELDDKVSELNTINGKIESTNDELAEVRDKIDELNKIENPTIIEQEELDKLIATNDELERTLYTLQSAQKLANKEAADTAYEWYRNITNMFDPDHNGWEKFWDSYAKAFAYNNAHTKDQTYLQVSNAVYEYAILQKHIKALQKELNDAIDKNDKDDADKLQKMLESEQEELKEYEQIVLSNISIWETYMGTLDQSIPKQKEAYEKIKEVVDLWKDISTQKYSDLVSAYNASEFSEVKKQIDDLASHGKLTSENFNKLTESNAKGITNFREALEELGHTDTDEVMRALNKLFADNADLSKVAAGNISDLADAYSKLQEKLDGLIDKQEKLADAFSKSLLGGELSAKEIYELIKEMPTLAGYLQRAVDGFTISTEGFQKINEESNEELREAVSKQLRDAQIKISKLEAREKLAEQDADLSRQSQLSNWQNEDINNQYKDVHSQYQQMVEDTRDIAESLDELKDLESSLKVTTQMLNEAFSESKMFTEGLKETYSNVKSEVSDYNQEIETITKAIDTLNNGALLSYDEMVALNEINKDLTYTFDEQGKGYSFIISELETLRDESYETRNNYINDRIAEAEAAIQEANETKAACEEQIKTLNGVEDAVDKVKLMGEISVANVKIDGYEDVIAKLKALQGALTDDSGKTNDVSSQLQNQIDYYNTILDAVSAVKDKYTEVLDNEINALQDSKDALQEANDERQRELDLIEKRNNLENAKKRKVYVYSEGEGFKQVQDEKAVKEAEEEYRDAINSVQEAEIDKAIAEKEKQKEALEKSLEDLLNSEQDIQDAIAIAKAVKSLGLSSPADLLNLSDDVKHGIIDGLADSTLQKDREDNKDNDKYTDVTLDSILSYLGSDKKASDIPQSLFDNISQSAYNSALKGFTDALKSDRENMVKNVSYNNSPVVNANFVINDASDPEKIGEVVEMHIRDLLQECSNSIK